MAFPVCFDSIDVDRSTCHLRFAALAGQQALYMMCFAQTAQQLYSLVTTKNRSVLRHRGLTQTEYVTLPT